jgi:hypothetical protein
MPSHGSLGVARTAGRNNKGREDNVRPEVTPNSHVFPLAQVTGSAGGKRRMESKDATAAVRYCK